MIAEPPSEVGGVHNARLFPAAAPIVGAPGAVWVVFNNTETVPGRGLGSYPAHPVPPPGCCDLELWIRTLPALAGDHAVRLVYLTGCAVLACDTPGQA